MLELDQFERLIKGERTSLFAFGQDVTEEQGSNCPTSGMASEHYIGIIRQ